MDTQKTGGNCQTENTTKIVLMRHANSHWNTELNLLNKLYEKKKIDTETFWTDHKILTSSTNPDILNAAQNEKGFNQCEDASKKIPTEFPNLKRILISPMRRTIQTFEESFKNHPNILNKTMKISFIPEMRECTNSACDIACWTQNEKDCCKWYDMYDWSFLDDYSCEMKPFWFLESMLDFEKERALDAMKGVNTVEEKRLKLLGNLIDGPWFPWNYESEESSQKRIKTAQKKISQVIIDENLNDGELAVISHAGTQREFTKSSSTEIPPKGYIFNNAELQEFDLKKE